MKINRPKVLLDAQEVLTWTREHFWGYVCPQYSRTYRGGSPVLAKETVRRPTPLGTRQEQAIAALRQPGLEEAVRSARRARAAGHTVRVPRSRPLSNLSNRSASTPV